LTILPMDFGSNGFYVVVRTAGTPTVSVTLGTNENGRLIYHRITGFTGTPAIDSGMTANYSGSATTTVSIASPNTADNNEAVLLSWKTGSSLIATPTGWTAGSGFSYYLTASSSGTSTAFNGTLSASNFYDAGVFGIYDGAPSWVPPADVARGIFPGSHTFTSGASITPNCQYDVNTETASATGTFTINLPTGCEPVNGQKLLLQIISPSGGTLTYSANSGYLVPSTVNSGVWPATSGAASDEDDFHLVYSGVAATPGWVLETYNQKIP
jgi:hypothetical protein